MKKFLLTFFSLFLLMASVVQAEQVLQTTFEDVIQHKWENSINELYDLDVIDGYSDGSFRPNNKISRAEFLRLVLDASLEGGISDDYAEACFNDLKGDECYAKYACFAKETGVIDGYQDGTFQAKKLISQPEALRIIFDAFGEDLQNTKGKWYEKYLNHSEWMGMYYFSVDQPVEHLMSRAQTVYMIAWVVGVGDDQIEPEAFYQNRYQSNVNYYTDNPEQCLVGEIYNEKLGSCDLECDSDPSCDLAVDYLLANLYEEEDGYTEDYDHIEKDQDSIEGVVSKYEVKMDSIELKSDVAVLGNDLVALKNNKEVHNEIWDYFVKLIPSEHREDFVEFYIFSDGPDEVMAMVKPTKDDPSKWILFVDPADAYVDGEINKKDISLTLIHEFAHLLSLNAKQVSPVVIDALDDDEFWAVYYQEVEKCKPNYYPGEGCSKSDSYLNQFYQTFWGEIADEHESFDYILDDEEYYQALNDFYIKYEADFVTDYAVTNPAEDFAETFAFYVIQQRPIGNDLSAQKIRFFYQFDELVELRDLIREQL